MSKENDIILGIDPGSNVMGFGVLDGNGKNPVFMDMGMLDLRKDGDHYKRISAIFNHTVKLIENYLPSELAIEAPFYGKNIQSMLKLGRAQGAAISAALTKDLPIYEYAPRKIKLAITGAGAASKDQVSNMLSRIFNIKDMPASLDATDGLAVALCHFYSNNAVIKSSKSKGWEDFVRKNPDRIK